MGVVDLSLQVVTTELISFSWPVLGVVSGAQVVITRRVLSRSDPPSTSTVLSISQLSLFVVAGSRSPRVLASVSLASTLTAGWIVGWWLLLGSVSEVRIQLVMRMPWVLGLIACGSGLLFSTTTLLIGRRIALARDLRGLRALRG